MVKNCQIDMGQNCQNEMGQNCQIKPGKNVTMSWVKSKYVKLLWNVGHGQDCQIKTDKNVKFSLKAFHLKLVWTPFCIHFSLLCVWQ